MKESIRDSAAALLRGEISRRIFFSRVTAIGLTAASATSMLSFLTPTATAGEGSLSGRSERPRKVKNITGGELMVEFLRTWNTNYVFGVGGSEEVGFLDALVDRADLQYILALHEGASLSMADGYARAVGRPAFVNLHSVVGTGNALTPMVNAFKDRTPLVITVGRQSTSARGREAFLEAANLHLLPRDYTRWTWDLLRSDNIAEILRRAYLVSRVPPMGPTFLTFSRDLWEQNIEEAVIDAPDRSPVSNNFLPDTSTIKRLTDALLAADNPVLVAGRELGLYGGMGELVKVAEMLGTTVMSDVPGSHSSINFPTTHPQYTGLFTLDPTDPKNFDLFWSIGGTMFTRFNKPARSPIPVGTTIVHTSIDGAEIGRNYPVDLAVTGNVKLILASLLEELSSKKLPKTAIERRRGRAEKLHHQRRKMLDKQAKKVWNQSPIAPEQLAIELNRQLDPQGVVVSELATSDVFLWRYLDFHNPGRLHVTSSGGGLGWGIGAAIGTKIGHPAREVCLLVGDGSFQFGVQGELVTDPHGLSKAIERCLKSVQAGAPYLLDVHIQPRQGGADSTWHGDFSVARNSKYAS